MSQNELALQLFWDKARNMSDEEAKIFISQIKKEKELLEENKKLITKLSPYFVDTETDADYTLLIGIILKKHLYELTLNNSYEFRLGESDIEVFEYIDKNYTSIKFIKTIPKRLYKIL